MTDDDSHKNQNIDEDNDENRALDATRQEAAGLNDADTNDSNESILNIPYGPPPSFYPRIIGQDNEMNNSISSSTRDFFRPIVSSNLRRHRVEWVYPDDYDGPRHEFEVDVSTENLNSENMEETSIDYVVDPNDVEVTLAVEGVVVQRRNCFLKICGVVICDDNFPLLVNLKVFAFILGTLFMAGIATTAFLVKEDISSSNTNHQKTDTAQPSEMMHEEPVIIDPRIANISQAILEVSGIVTLEKNSSQNKALNWILYEDDLELDYNSSNLLQRYALMVFFFNLSGENWIRNDGYGSGMNECEWFGISCRVIDGFKQIQLLELARNGLKGPIPYEITLLSRLKDLILSTNEISGSIPISIGQLMKLERLSLDFNRLTGTIPSGITKCKNLVRIIVKENSISGLIPEFGRKQWRLLIIILDDNRLSGTIPSSLGSLAALQFLSMNSNRLNGTIPPELGNANGLNVLNIKENKLTGRIPSSLANLSSLQRILLSYNFLTGVVPPKLYQHSSIEKFTLHNNFLTGTIPSASDFLPSVEGIHLHNNLINGTIPEILGDLNKLTELRLHSLMLSGTVPPSLCYRKMAVLTADCWGENAEVLCSCCTQCF